MPLINFKKQFATAVAMGSKCQTIRKTRKIPIKKGDTLHLYSGLRTKEREKLLVAKCKSVQDIVIEVDKMELESPDKDVLKGTNLTGNAVSVMLKTDEASSFGDDTERYLVRVTIDGKILNKQAISKLAKADGFENELEFAKFFITPPDELEYFKGQLIKW